MKIRMGCVCVDLNCRFGMGLLVFLVLCLVILILCRGSVWLVLAGIIIMGFLVLLLIVLELILLMFFI